MILLNFKLYKESFGDKGVALAKIAKEVGEKYKVRIVVATSALEAERIKRESGVEVWIENIDGFMEGRGTGWVSGKQAMEMGIKGSLINHSEHKISKGKAESIIKSRVKGFEIMCCSGSKGQIDKWVRRAKPDWILYEPAYLIASKESSVAKEMGENLKGIVEVSGKVPLLVGAGIKDKSDVEMSLKMGAKGVGLASAFVLSKEPRKVLEDIASAFGV